MTVSDIERVHEDFIRGAERAVEAGFDGVEIIGSAGYLICQFLSPLTNHRNDHYGGSFENRIRFARELIEKMRSRLGPGYPVTIRISGNDFVPGSNTTREMIDIVKIYEEAGIDAINVTGGWHESKLPQISMEVPRGCFSYLARNIKEHVSIPVMASNRITSPCDAREIIKNHQADMVNLGRVLVADPFWPQKTQEGREKEIRPCIACSQGCMDEIFNVRPLKCIINPRAGFESKRNIMPVESPLNIMVIGSGPAGLQAAITAAEAGHKVNLYEKKDKIGGQLWIAGTPPGKKEIWKLISYFRELLHLQKVSVNLKTRVTIDLIQKLKPDYIICAEGAEPLIPPIRGIENKSVLSAWDILKNDPPTGQNIAVIGGGSVGLETSLFLAGKGTLSPETLHFLFINKAENNDILQEFGTRGTKKITVFEKETRAGKDIGKSSRWVTLQNCEKHGIAINTGADVKTIKEKEVVFYQDDKEHHLHFDTIINATGSRSLQQISTGLEKIGIPYTIIGDGLRPARIGEAIHEAFLAVSEIPHTMP